MEQESDYNKRLFGKGFRAWFHFQRFKWLEKKCSQYSPGLDLVVELGCFDGRSLGYLGGRPSQYYGFDANWEGGLDLAKQRNGDNGFHFIQCSEPSGLLLKDQKKATLALSLETLEHIPVQMLEAYLEKLSAITQGYLFITVPNEKGPLFLTKHLVKRFLFADAEAYALSEVFWATIGKTEFVKRNEHKGFDYDALRETLSTYFDPVEARGIPFPHLPLFLNPQIGLVMKSKNLPVPN